MKLLERVRVVLRTKNYSPRTEEAYCAWIVRYVRFHGLRHPAEMGADEAVAFLNHLAVVRRLSASSQNQALSALLFLYRKVLEMDLGDVGATTRARKPRTLPVVLTPTEVRAVLRRLDGPDRIAGALMYGGGLRVSEVASLRVKDLDLERLEIVVRRGKGAVDRVTTLPGALVGLLREQIARVVCLAEADDEAPDFGGVTMPDGLERKFPRAAKEVPWLYLLPAARRCRDEQGRLRRHHRDVSHVQRSVKAAVRRSGVAKKASSHTFRHSFATHLLDSGTDIRTVQKLMGHRSVRTTMVYLHLVGRGAYGTRSPLDLSLDVPASAGANLW
ncbi:MAG: integron integrase [Myxococcota bacterium]